MLKRGLILTVFALLVSTALSAQEARRVVLRWAAPGGGAVGPTAGAETLQNGLITVDIVGAGPEARPDVRLECQNAETQEQGSVLLRPLSAGATDTGASLQFSLASQWHALPYPIDPWVIQSKPLAIIAQRTEQAPNRLSPAALRAEFARTAGYMLETAHHAYRLPLGDGILRCRFAVALDGGELTSDSLDIVFGRGLPDGTYPRDLSTPDMRGWPTWVLDDSFTPPSTQGPAVQEELRMLLAYQAERTPERIAQIRQWDNGSPVAPWIEITMASVLESHINPPRAARAYALVSVAMYEALVAASRTHAPGAWLSPCSLEPRLSPLPENCEDSAALPEHALVAGAASTVLAYLFPDGATEYAALADEAAESRLWAGTSFPSDVQAGLALGRAVGERIIERAESDGSDASFSGIPPQGPGMWVPALPDYAGPLEPMAAQWKPWNLERPDQYRPGPPPQVGTPGFEAGLREVYAVTSRLSLEQEQIASDWEDKLGTYTPPGHWNAIAVQMVRDAGLSTARAALLFATMNTAQADAFIATWDTKYAYWSVRPISVIRDRIDPNWQPYIYTPPFPSYISGHATTSGAASAVLAEFFPQQSQAINGWAEEAAMSRLYGGIHFRIDNEVGLRVGRQVAEEALDRVELLLYGGL